jgi:hypothetical protein
MNKLITDFGNWLISSGALVTAFVFLWKYLKPVMEAKKTHAETEQSKAIWSLLETMADNAVVSMVNQPMLGSQKFETAVHKVNQSMLNQGFDISDIAIKTAVQAAYEKSDLTHAQDPVFKAIKKAPNRANNVEASAKG